MDNSIETNIHEPLEAANRLAKTLTDDQKADLYILTKEALLLGAKKEEIAPFLYLIFIDETQFK
jgi:hypothetical protein